MDDQKKILKLAAQIACIDLESLQESYGRRLLIIDSQIQAFRELEKEYRQRLADMDEAINHLKAVCQVCSRLNILCSPIGTKEEGPQDDTDKDINQKLTDWH